jgi:amino acid permease
MLEWVENTKAMKLRLLLMVCILSALGAGLLVARGFSEAIVGLLAVGIVLLMIGLLWK